MTAICPHCGYDLIKDRPILLNDFSMFGPNAPLLHNGRAIRLTTMERELVWTLIKSAPAAVMVDTLLDRIGSTAEPSGAHVLVCRIRKKILAAGARNPIATRSRPGGRRGYAWIIGVVE